jgi:hypothetical protein
MSRALIESALRVLIRHRNDHHPDRRATRALIRADIKALRGALPC